MAFLSLVLGSVSRQLIKELRMQIVEHMEETKSNPEKVKNFFRKASVRYASNNHVLLPEQYHLPCGIEISSADAEISPRHRTAR